MADQTSSDVKLEIGHVLFIDLVGYSKLLIKEQSGLLQIQSLRAMGEMSDCNALARTRRFQLAPAANSRRG